MEFIILYIFDVQRSAITRHGLPNAIAESKAESGFGDDREGARGREDNVCSIASFQFSQFGEICRGLLIMNLLKLLTLRGYSLTVAEYVA